MTDNEIVKALKQCKDCNTELRNSCNGCLLLNYYPYCTENGIDLGVDLINRLQTKADKLEIKNSELEYDLSLIRQERKETIKSEAYKEFAEKVNKMLNSRASFSNLIESITCESIVKEIDNLLKELVGDEK